MATIIIAVEKPKFPMGDLVTTPGAGASLTPEEMAAIIKRHVQGDWGEVCADDAAANEVSLKEGFRLMSVYTVNGEKVWVITEADRSVTTILLPDEY